MIGITLVVAVALVVSLRKPSKIKPPKTTEGMCFLRLFCDTCWSTIKTNIAVFNSTASVASVSEESSSSEISLREVYLSTNNLSELNSIGQGIAG